MSWQKHISKGTLAIVKSDYETAQRELQTALEVAERTYGRKDERFLHSMALLGHAHFKLHNYNDAQDLLSTCLAAETQDHEADLNRAANLILLAAIKRAEGDTAGANYRFQQVADAVRPPESTGADGADGADAVKSMDQLFNAVHRTERQHMQSQFQQLLQAADAAHAGAVQQKLGSAASKERWQELLNHSEELLNSNTEKADMAAYNLSLEATKLSYRVFEHDHVNVARCLRVLGLCSQRVRMYHQAETLLKRAATIAEGSDDSSLRMCTQLNLSMFYAEICDYRQALNHLTRAADWLVQGAENSATDEPDKLSRAMVDMLSRAEIYSAYRETVRQAVEAEECDRLEHAGVLYSRALTLLHRIFPSDHLEIAQMLYFKGNVLRKLGNQTESALVNEQAESIENRTNTTARKWHKVEQQLQPFRIPPSRACPD